VRKEKKKEEDRLLPCTDYILYVVGGLREVCTARFVLFGGFCLYRCDVCMRCGQPVCLSLFMYVSRVCARTTA